MFGAMLDASALIAAVARDKVRSRELHMADGTNGSPQRDQAPAADPLRRSLSPDVRQTRRSLTRRDLDPV